MRMQVGFFGKIGAEVIMEGTLLVGVIHGAGDYGNIWGEARSGQLDISMEHRRTHPELIVEGVRSRIVIDLNLGTVTASTVAFVGWHS